MDGYFCTRDGVCHENISQCPKSCLECGFVPAKPQVMCPSCGDVFVSYGSFLRELEARREPVSGGKNG